MFVINKIVGGIINPLVMGLLLMLAAVYFARKRGSSLCILLGVVWFWVWSTPAMYSILTGGAMRSFPPVVAENALKADAIVILGGGMIPAANGLPYADLTDGADRVWHAARLYHAGAAPLIIASGGSEQFSSRPFLLDLKVPPQAIVIEGEARNTEENAVYTERLMQKMGKKRVLLVTSYWHMPRSLDMFERTSLEVIPAPTDHGQFYSSVDNMGWVSFLRPDVHFLMLNSDMFKEVLGRWGYRIFRKELHAGK